jgi:TusA-related sulfurtransferase
VEAAKAVRALDRGAVLLVIATDPGIALDMPMWCKATRNEHLGTFQDGPAWKSFVRKA